MKALLGLGALLSAAVSPAASGMTGALAASCVRVDTLVSATAFRSYPADPVWRGPWHKPDVRNGTAHRYRTVVREEGTAPPDFAGHLKVVSYGCGAGLKCPLFVDLKTGKVAFVPALASVEQPYDLADVPRIADPRLVYHVDSRLLVAVGTRNEDDRLTGAAQFEWRGDRLRLIRFIPHTALCRDGTGQGSPL